MSFKIKKITAGLTALALATTFSGCSDTSWAVKNGDGSVELSAGSYIYQMLNAYMSATEKVATDATAESVLKKTIDDMPAEDWMKSELDTSLKKYVAIEEKFNELELTLTDEEMLYADYIVAQMWPNYGEMFEGYGIGEQSYRSSYVNMLKNDAVFMKYYGVEGIEAVSEEEIKTYMTENYSRAKYIALNLKDAEGNLLKSDGKAEVMTMAEEYLERAKNGEDMAELSAEYEAYWKEFTGQNEEKDDVTNGDPNQVGANGEILYYEDAEGNTFTLPQESEVSVSEVDANGDAPEEETAVADSENESAETTAPTDEDEETTTTTAPAEEISVVNSDNTDLAISSDDSEDDSTVDANTDEYSLSTDASGATILKKGEYSPSKLVNETVFNEMTAGEYRIIEDGEYYYVVQKFDLFDDETYFETNKDSILYEMRTDDYNAKLDEWSANVVLVYNNAAVNRYKFKKFEN